MKARRASVVTGLGKAVQARGVHVVHAAGIAVLLSVSLALGGCAGPAADGPVQWWHQLEGGRIAQDRPAPPNADAPYPNLASVPARPAATPPDIRAKIANGLVADHANAVYGASQVPLLPAHPVIVQHPPQLADASSATMQAAEPPRAAPRGKVAATPLAPPPDAPPADTSAPDMPAMPAVPPSPPSLPGVVQTTAAMPPPVAPLVVAAPVPEPVAGAPVALTFAPGSAALPPDAAKSLQSLASQRGTRTILAAGFGDAAGVDAGSQQDALALALARARSIALALVQAGVPDAAIRQEAQALGAGGIARILE